MRWLNRFLLRFKYYRSFTNWTKSVLLPGFGPLSLYEVVIFFVQEFLQGTLTTKASALAYNFMLALFPATIFLFTLIPYIPINNFQDELLNLIGLVLPNERTSQFFDSNVVVIIKHQNGQLLSVGFLSALILATNGVNNLMRAFNRSSLVMETRTWLKRRWVALILTVVISTSMLIAITIMIAGQSAISFLQAHFFSKGHFWLYIFALSRWIIIVLIFFTTVSILYRYGPAHKQRWAFINPGSMMATGLAVLTSLGFTYYINHFSHYNKIYGSIGTLIVVMLWLYLNSLIILMGFELNANIDFAKRNIKVVKPTFNSFRH
ncbi:YihY/virulence factor BrkB family protein [Mucilaginibacter sp. X5P1]|uniref:YihY/virulence factor BrkB family protein n=1 Tax=Mucilaginibacter sp. X5P1 TaxID=2723088 RepID=UPI00161F930C|nr:YihY/virulence factor BrkB family protein [Mucilaginibacter sp. X5P1]MBB6136890.1 membrane protein [Mucilaginibacter sp. X5P1]